jgi:hypothetical protein
MLQYKIRGPPASNLPPFVNLTAMSPSTRTHARENSLLPVDRILLWFGSQVTRHYGRELGRGYNESFYSYFSRWLVIKRMRLEWNVENFPDAQPGKQIVCRPIGKSHFKVSANALGTHCPPVNGSRLPPCFAGEGANEETAKETACKSLVEACRCVS